MSSTPEERPFHDSNLESPEYRQRLMRKLNCLTAVLEVAIAKVRRSLAGPDPDVERLKRIQSNLSDTLAVCQRARRALERHESLPEDLPTSLSGVVDFGPRDAQQAEHKTSRRRPVGLRTEMVSKEELEKFRGLGPIDRRAVRHVDLDDLARRLQGEL